MEVDIPYSVGLPEMQDKIRERVAQCQRACIAHEYLVFLLEYIIIIESNHHTEKSDCKHCPDGVKVYDVESGDYSQCNG